MIRSRIGADGDSEIKVPSYRWLLIFFIQFFASSNRPFTSELPPDLWISQPSYPSSLGRAMGGAKHMGGGKRTRERALPKSFGPLQKSFWSALSWIFVQEKQSTDTWRGWKTYRTRGVQNPFLGGVSFVRFSTRLFFPPPHGVLWQWRELRSWDGVCSK